MIVTLTNSALQSASISTGKTLWRFKGDARFSTSPLIVGGTVFVGTELGNVYAVSLMTGKELWKMNVGAGIYGYEGMVSNPAVGLTAGQNTLLVPAGYSLFAFGPR